MKRINVNGGHLEHDEKYDVYHAHTDDDCYLGVFRTRVEAEIAITHENTGSKR